MEKIGELKVTRYEDGEFYIDIHETETEFSAWFTDHGASPVDWIVRSAR